ncbi:MAG: hypothetical protein WD431_10160 [Cyclobacteriaceae bacterium]
MSKDQIKQLQKALAVADIKAPQEAIAITLELARAVKTYSGDLDLGKIEEIATRIKQDYSKESMNHEYRFLGELEELASVKQVRDAISIRKGKILDELGL